jgi:5-methylcytosine-specific restriction protein A
MSPTAPLSGCSVYGCPEDREPGYRTCSRPSHRTLERAANRTSQRRRRRIRRVYGTKAWEELSARKLRLSPTCELAIKCGGDAPATDVDHVDPIAWGGRELPPISELRSACHACHSAHTAETMLERDHAGRWGKKRVPKDTGSEELDRARRILERRGKR